MRDSGSTRNGEGEPEEIRSPRNSPSAHGAWAASSLSPCVVSGRKASESASLEEGLGPDGERRLRTDTQESLHHPSLVPEALLVHRYAMQALAFGQVGRSVGPSIKRLLDGLIRMNMYAQGVVHLLPGLPSQKAAPASALLPRARAQHGVAWG